MGLLYVGYSLDCVVEQGRKFGKKDLGKMITPDLKHEDALAESHPLAFAKCDKDGKLLDQESAKAAVERKAQKEARDAEDKRVKDAEEAAKKKLTNEAQERKASLRTDDGVEAREEAKAKVQATRRAGPRKKTKKKR